jgi:hypothetical protein
MVINYVETDIPGVMAQTIIQWHLEADLTYEVYKFDTCQGRLKAIVNVVSEKETGKVTDIFARYYV